ncbi:tetratricopeptide repeat protein [Caenimonas koreensis]|uniref:tetratricopeptide repeat protein n=1 Tax=Caenimonas koreensis TaxID=367474 RepID=UPI003784ECD7
MFGRKSPPAVPSAAPVAPVALTPDLQKLFTGGFQHHQAGRLADAAAAYREVLATAPGHFDARHLLGVIALQQGRLDEARDQITQALRSSPRDATAYGNLGTVHLHAGRLNEARASYETALAFNPKNLDAAVNLSLVLRRLGDPAAAAVRLRAALAAGGAIELRNELGAALLEAGDAAGAAKEFEAVLRKHPAHANAHNNLALALERSGKFDEAIRQYERAIALDGSLAATGNRAALLARRGQHEEARMGFEDAVSRDPRSAQAHANLGALLRELGELDTARTHLLEALHLDPRLFEARFNLAQLALAAGDTPSAQAQLDRLLADEPRSAEVHALRAQVLLAQSLVRDASLAIDRAIEFDPQLAQAHHLRGLIWMAMGDAKLAQASHEQALRLDPEHAAARWASVMARLPATRDEEAEALTSRASFAQGVSQLDAFFQGPRLGAGRAVVGSTQPFYLAYQRGNHRDLLVPYGQLCARLSGLAQASPAQAAPPSPAVHTGRPVRVGIVSAHIRDHSVWTAIVRGWVANVDRSRIEVSVFHVGAISDTQTDAARQLVPHFDGRGASAQEWQRRIEAFAPHALVFPEVGMDAMTAKLASRRLAPWQAASWGHPLTTGLPTIDAFISAQALEPSHAQDHYSEQLIALPGLGVCYEPLGVTPERIDRRSLGLPADAPLLLCPGLAQKYAPEDDGLWADIARRLPAARLVFFRSGAPVLQERLARRMRGAFDRHGLNIDDHVVWLAHLSRPQFFGLMQEATLFLDSVGFSGFNTAMQAIECGLPVVALEGDAMRGRFAAGILREAGLDECVATDTAHYTDIAVALASDSAQRSAVASHLRKHGPALFGTKAPVDALATLLLGRYA